MADTCLGVLVVIWSGGPGHETLLGKASHSEVAGVSLCGPQCGVCTHIFMHMLVYLVL